MLVISRKVGESIVVGDSVVVTVVQMQRGRVRIGVEAPPQVLVLREELRQRPLAARPEDLPQEAVEHGAGR
jgi:carbon storage regulator